MYWCLQIWIKDVDWYLHETTKCYSVVKCLPSTFLSFEFRDYVQSATDLVSGNSLHNLRDPDIFYKAALCMTSLDIAFSSYRRVNMEFSSAEIRTILKLPFVRGESAIETFCEINGDLTGGTQSLWTAEECLGRFITGEISTMDKPAGGRPETTRND